MAQVQINPKDAAGGLPWAREGCAALACAAEAVLTQCEAFVLSIPDVLYASPSTTRR